MVVSILFPRTAARRYENTGASFQTHLALASPGAFDDATFDLAATSFATGCVAIVITVPLAARPAQGSRSRRPGNGWPHSRLSRSRPSRPKVCQRRTTRSRARTPRIREQVQAQILKAGSGTAAEAPQAAQSCRRYRRKLISDGGAGSSATVRSCRQPGDTMRAIRLRSHQSGPAPALEHRRDGNCSCGCRELFPAYPAPAATVTTSPPASMFPTTRRSPPTHPGDTVARPGDGQ